jgi:hypothetical protein
MTTTSERKALANRRNAARSTGPRSPAGKSRARGNRLRHGLDAAVSHYGCLSAQVERLASALVDTGDPLIRDLAAQAAEAQLTLLRVRQMRVAAIATVPREHAGAAKGAALGKLVMQVLEPRLAREELPSSTLEKWRAELEVINPPEPPSWSPDRAARDFAAALPVLIRMERYERRAFSRRRRALRRLLAARLVANPAKPPLS